MKQLPIVRMNKKGEVRSKTQKTKSIKYPLCIDGKMNCPPEDCGGVWGYMSMLQILEDPNHPEYEIFLEWLGGDFEPEFFNKHIINELLHRKDY